MNWTDIFKTLEYTRDNMYNNIYIYETTTTFTIPETGYYKIICVGAGGSAAALQSSTTSGADTTTCYSGGAGGVAIKTKRMVKNESLSITISIEGEASCDGMTATAGSNGSSAGASGGTATGGQYNYIGNSGNVAHSTSSSAGTSANGGSVGCIIPGIMSRDDINLRYSLDNNSVFFAHSGWGFLGHGGGAGACAAKYSYPYAGTVKGEKQSAAVFIIPLPTINLRG